MVANPVDSLTQVALQRLNWTRGRIIGSGTVLDSARFRFLLSSHCGIDARNVHAYILGEHGDSEVAAWSMTHIAGVKIKEYCRICNMCDASQKHDEIVQQVRDSAYHIIDYKGSTYYAIGLSLMRITEAILRDEKSILTVSFFLEGEYNIDNVCLSVPCVVGKNGVDKVIYAQLYEKEQKDLQLSAQTLRRVYRDIKL